MFRNCCCSYTHLSVKKLLPKSFQVSNIRTVSSQSATGRLCAAVSIYYLLVFIYLRNSLRKANPTQVQVIIQKHTWYFDKRSFDIIFFVSQHVTVCQRTNHSITHISSSNTLNIEHIQYFYVFFFFLCSRIRERLSGELGDKNVSGWISLNRHRHVVFNVCRPPMPVT